MKGIEDLSKDIAFELNKGLDSLNMNYPALIVDGYYSLRYHNHVISIRFKNESFYLKTMKVEDTIIIFKDSESFLLDLLIRL